MHYVFVYGSLLSGFGNHHVIASGGLVGPARTTNNSWRMLDLGSFPALVHDADGDGVVGELYLVDDDTLAALDRLEGHPNFYRREQTGVLVGSTGYIAWVYVLVSARPGSHVVPGNDWRARCCMAPVLDDPYDDDNPYVADECEACGTPDDYLTDGLCDICREYTDDVDESKGIRRDDNGEIIPESDYTDLSDRQHEE